ncbi:MAG TPA: hypothetical protein VFU04_03065 [Solirubrobacterales bacterium]|nr:hypothetical protein [Solirubrobacterales bacterium]
MVLAGGTTAALGAYLPGFRDLPDHQHQEAPGAWLPSVPATVAGWYTLLGGVWLTTTGLCSGAAAAWAWWRSEDVSTAAGDGAAIGFIYGIPVTICAAIMLILGI